MVNAIQPPDLCGICIQPMLGQQVVPHEGITHPSHAIHRDCFLDWKRRVPIQQVVCLKRCENSPKYVDRPILFDQLLADAQRVHYCAICQIDLDPRNVELGPTLTHPWAEDRSHSVHKECLRNWYAQKGNLNCPKNCGGSFPIKPLLSPEELRYLEKKEKRIMVAATAALAGATLYAWCFLLKLVAQISLFTFRTYITPFLNLLGGSNPRFFLKVFIFGTFYGLSLGVMFGVGCVLLRLVEKVGSYFRRSPPNLPLLIVEGARAGVFGTLLIFRCIHIIGVNPYSFNFIAISITSIGSIAAGGMARRGEF